MRGRSPVIQTRHATRSTLSATAARFRAAAAPAVAPIPALPIALSRGPYQNNGASPWYANLALGTPGQPLKIALDTGAAFIWVTSSLCPPTSCQHYSNGRFIYQNSSSFQWVNQNGEQVDFGPWGSMTVEVGQDNVALVAGSSMQLDMYLSSQYSGSQFAQLDWDGGIGIPSGSAYADPSTSFSVATLMDDGLMDPENPFISFYTDASTGQGKVLFGGIDQNVIDPYSGIYMPWTPYTQFPNVMYIWSSVLFSYYVGSTQVAANVQFCLDSGSSQFKGDNNIMNQTLSLISQSPNLDVVLNVGLTLGGEMGQIVVPPSVYNVTIQAGPNQGQTLPQFNPLGLTNLVLVGSVLMDQLYTIYAYNVVSTGQGYNLSPVGMYLFNKVNGPSLIKTKSKKPLTLGRRPVHKL
jgi:saccharopepsin